MAAISAGYFYEIFGRRNTATISLILASLAMAAIPWTAPYLVPWLFMVKCFSSFVVTIPICNPLCADYLDKTAIARGNAMNSVGAILGEVLSMGVLFRLTANMNEKSSFGLAGGIGVFSAVVVYMTVQDRKQQPTPEQEVI
jgi:MFS family permease